MKKNTTSKAQTIKTAKTALTLASIPGWVMVFTATAPVLGVALVVTALVAAVVVGAVIEVVK